MSADGPATVASLDRDGYRGLARDQPVVFARLALNIARQLSNRIGAAATALGDPIWRYRNPEGPTTVTMRRPAHTLDIEPAELEEISLEGVDAELESTPPLEPPGLPDQDPDVGILDTSPGIDLRAVHNDADPSDDESA